MIQRYFYKREIDEFDLKNIHTIGNLRDKTACDLGRLSEN